MQHTCSRPAAGDPHTVLGSQEQKSHAEEWKANMFKHLPPGLVPPSPNAPAATALFQVIRWHPTSETLKPQ